MTRLTLGVLISGRGSNLQALLDAAADPAFPAEVKLVLSNRPGAGGLERARKAGVQALTLDHKSYNDRKQFEDDIHSKLEESDIDLLCLAGFMRVLTGEFLARWSGRVINIHPSLLPLFKGLEPQAQAIEAGVRVSGCTVHYVVPEVDSGPIIGQSAVAVLPEDTADTLAERILAAEHRLYPDCVRAIAEGRIRLEAGRVIETPR